MKQQVCSDGACLGGNMVPDEKRLLFFAKGSEYVESRIRIASQNKAILYSATAQM